MVGLYAPNQDSDPAAALAIEANSIDEEPGTRLPVKDWSEQVLKSNSSKPPASAGLLLTCISVSRQVWNSLSKKGGTRAMRRFNISAVTRAE
jgi:hypothetical protein